MKWLSKTTFWSLHCGASYFVISDLGPASSLYCLHCQNPTYLSYLAFSPPKSSGRRQGFDDGKYPANMEDTFFEFGSHNPVLGSGTVQLLLDLSAKQLDRIGGFGAQQIL
jgi:hypothetical protein